MTLKHAQNGSLKSIFTMAVPLASGPSQQGKLMKTQSGASGQRWNSSIYQRFLFL